MLLRQIQHFQTIVQENSFTQAAELCHISQSGISQSIKSLYSGNEFNRAIAAFSEKYPNVEITVVSGNHEDLYDGLRFGRIDLALNDQRRAFSNAYENRILMETACYVEPASHNPLSKLETVSADELKNTPCMPDPPMREKFRSFRVITRFL